MKCGNDTFVLSFPISSTVKSASDSASSSGEYSKSSDKDESTEFVFCLADNLCLRLYSLFWSSKYCTSENNKINNEKKENLIPYFFV